jgi:undecaprenyl phosphate-alpha-L-ara4N flippase subunit ArnE
MTTKLWAVGLMLFTTFLTSSAQIFYKIGVETLTLDLFALITNVNLIIGLFLYAIGGGLMIISFRGGEVSVLYPIVATSYIWVSFLSIIFLNELMNIYKWMGVSIIFLGIVSIGFGSKEVEAKEGAIVS